MAAASVAPLLHGSGPYISLNSYATLVLSIHLSLVYRLHFLHKSNIGERRGKHNIVVGLRQESESKGVTVMIFAAAIVTGGLSIYLLNSLI